MARDPIKPTNANLDEYAEPLLARWLIEAALQRADLTYGAAKMRLERDVGFSSIGRATRLGHPAGQLMDRIHAVYPEAPLLNTLLVLQQDRMPSTGAGPYMARHFKVPKLARDGIRDDDPKLWRKYFDLAANEVYIFADWPNVYRNVYGLPYEPDTGSLSPFDPKAGTERDGQSPRGGGEGENHRFLRLWVKANPKKITSKSLVHAETEVVLKSADRVDVVYYLEDTTLAIEVKSQDSNEVDLERGIYQCVKYRAVMQAMDPRTADNVAVLLITEQPLPGHLKALAKILDIPHKMVSPKKED